MINLERYEYLLKEQLLTRFRIKISDYVLKTESIQSTLVIRTLLTNTTTQNIWIWQVQFKIPEDVSEQDLAERAALAFINKIQPWYNDELVKLIEEYDESN